MDEQPFQKFESLSALHRALGLPKPLHPLISLLENAEGIRPHELLAKPHVMGFYKISYKSNLQGKLKYGQHFYDFDEGGMFFVSPNQRIASYADNGEHAGWTLLIHPDFFLTYPLAARIKRYGFFSYNVNEALHLSEKERDTIIAVFRTMQDELSNRIDDFSQDVIVSQVELLLNYANRFYKRQFITRKPFSNALLENVEQLLEEYFVHSTKKGIPTVQLLAAQLNMSPGYLSDMLRSLTGQNAQQHIHAKLVEKAKEKLAATESSIGEIAYQLGFEHSQSFSKFFKQKTKLSPLEFRKLFN